MPTPQETRFLRLAVGRKVLTRQQAQTCLEFQKQKQQEGSKIPLWDCTVLTSMLDQSVAEKLQDEAGGLKTDKLGEFTIVRKLGEGGMGSVWMALGPDKQKVALKVLPDQLARQRQFLTRFFREAQASIKLQHENIVRGIDVGEDQGNYYFAMEFVQGRSVREMLEESGPMEVEAATRIIRQAAGALAYAHEHGIIHRDIKPDNIMVTRDGTAKLADLGLARQRDAELTALTRTGTGMGTPFYMAPEQSVDAKRADERSDVYCLGASWYHMVTGQVPFTGNTPLEIMQKHMKEPVKSPQIVRSEVPRNVAVLIQRMMAKKPDDRIQSAGEVCQIIDEKCLGERNLADELGVAEEAKTKQTLWDMKVAIGERVEKRRLSTAEVRSRIRNGQITKDTPTRRVGVKSPYQPASSYRELAGEFPREYGAATRPAKPGATTTRMQLHTMMTQFDSEQRKYRWKKKLRKLLPLLIELAVAAVVLGLLWHFRGEIRELIGGLIGGGGEAP